jgi:hypothetical protein
MVDFVFEQGEEIATGNHGETDYVFAAGSPVPNTGASTFVFESGIGLGGALSYAVNGGERQAMEPIQTAESVTSFYGYDTEYTNSAAHGYWEFRQTTIFVHEDTRNGDLSLVVTDHDPAKAEGNNDYQTGIVFDPNITGYILTDEEDDDEYTTEHAYREWNDDRTDGFVYDLTANSGIQFTFGDHPDFSGDTPMDGWRIITQDGPTPNGGNVEYYSLADTLEVYGG